VDWAVSEPWIREKYLDVYHTYRNMSFTGGAHFAPDDPDLAKQKDINIVAKLKFINSVNDNNCLK
jgi:hypothetical protein